MTEATTAKEQQEDDGSPEQISVLRVIAILFLTVSLLVAIAIMLRPLPGFPPKVFPGNAEMALWLLFTLSLAFGIVLNALGARKENEWRFSNVGGTIYVILGFVSAVEIFLLRAKAPGGTPSTNSLWFLFMVLTVLGAIGVYRPVRSKWLEAKEAKSKAEEARRQALAKERRRTPTIVRLKIRRYYVSEKKIFDCKD